LNSCGLLTSVRRLHVVISRGFGWIGDIKLWHEIICLILYRYFSFVRVFPPQLQSHYVSALARYFNINVEHIRQESVPSALEGVSIPMLLFGRKQNRKTQGITRPCVLIAQGTFSTPLLPIFSIPVRSILLILIQLTNSFE
jgi:hypothetical protein